MLEAVSARWLLIRLFWFEGCCSGYDPDYEQEVEKCVVHIGVELMLLALVIVCTVGYMQTRCIFLGESAPEGRQTA